MTMQQETHSGLPDSPFFQNETYDVKQHAGRSGFRNVGPTERYTSLAAGAIVTMLGVARRDNIGAALGVVGAAILYRGITGNCPAYSALGIDNNSPEAAAQRQQRRQKKRDLSRGFRVTQAFTIDKPAEELYRYWRELSNLPRIMTHLEDVRVIDDKRSHWTARAPAIAGGKVEWDAVIVNDVPNELISWRSLAGADVENSGSVRFKPGPRGTQVHVDMRYRTPAGRLGKWIATLFGENPEHQVREDLRNFKRVMEIGEVPTTQGQSRGTCVGRGMRALGLGDNT